MADKKAAETAAQPDATATDGPAEEKTVWFNTTQGTHPRHHQPADRKEADRVNKERGARRTATAKVASTFPSEQGDPKEVVKSAKDANDEASELNDKGE